MNAEEVAQIVQAGLDKTLEFEMVEADEDHVVLTWTVSPQHLQPYGIVHGGTYCAAIESSASIGAAIWFGNRGRVVGVSNQTDFLSSVIEGASPRRPRRFTADVASNSGWSRSATTPSASWRAVRCVCRTSPGEFRNS